MGVRPLVKPLVFLYLVTQLLLAIPAGAAASAPVHSPQGSCAHMSSAPAHERCPCCPDGAGSMKDCLAACTLAATMTAPQITVPVVHSRQAVFPILTLDAAWTADPPLKPPPIA